MTAFTDSAQTSRDQCFLTFGHFFNLCITLLSLAWF